MWYDRVVFLSRLRQHAANSRPTYTADHGAGRACLPPIGCFCSDDHVCHYSSSSAVEVRCSVGRYAQDADGGIDFRVNQPTSSVVLQILNSTVCSQTVNRNVFHWKHFSGSSVITTHRHFCLTPNFGNRETGVPDIILERKIYSTTVSERDAGSPIFEDSTSVQPSVLALRSFPSTEPIRVIIMNNSMPSASRISVC